MTDQETQDKIEEQQEMPEFMKLGQQVEASNRYWSWPPPPPPAPDRPTRDSSRKTKREDRKPSNTRISPMAKPFTCPVWILRFIDWWNELCGVEKSKGKRKEHTEEMATLADLFDEVESGDGTEQTYTYPEFMERFFPNDTWPDDRERGTDHK